MVIKDFFHYALIVPDLDPALEELSSLLGYEWGNIWEGVLAVYQPDTGHREIPMRIAMSAQPPHIEVIEGRAGTPWELSTTGSNIHHIAFYTDDLDGESRDVATSFCPFEICGVGADGTLPSTFTYHQRGGLRVELVDRHRKSTALRSSPPSS
jgi:hypothetical protein